MLWRGARRPAMYELLRTLWHEIKTPSTEDETFYQMIIIAIAHALLAATVVSILCHWFGVEPKAAWVLVPVFYWFWKEWSDLKRGGGGLDGLIDTGFIFLGGFYPGEPWWPLTVLLLSTGVSLVFYATRK